MPTSVWLGFECDRRLVFLVVVCALCMDHSCTNLVIQLVQMFLACW